MNRDVNVYQAALLTSSVTDAAVKWKTPNKFFTPIIIIFTHLLLHFHTYCSHFTPLLFHFHTYCSHFTLIVLFVTYCPQSDDNIQHQLINLILYQQLNIG